MIAEFIAYAHENGINVQEDPHFTGVREHQGRPYFNVDLGERCGSSPKFDQLETLASKEGKFTVEPSGLERAAIFPAA
jgi:hypothetical protein